MLTKQTNTSGGGVFDCSQNGGHTFVFLMSMGQYVYRIVYLCDIYTDTVFLCLYNYINVYIYEYLSMYIYIYKGAYIQSGHFVVGDHRSQGWRCSKVKRSHHNLTRPRYNLVLSNWGNQGKRTSLVIFFLVKFVYPIKRYPMSDVIFQEFWEKLLKRKEISLLNFEAPPESSRVRAMWVMATLHDQISVETPVENKHVIGVIGQVRRFFVAAHQSCFVALL